MEMSFSIRDPWTFKILLLLLVLSSPVPAAVASVGSKSPSTLPADPAISKSPPTLPLDPAISKSPPTLPLDPAINASPSTLPLDATISTSPPTTTTTTEISEPSSLLVDTKISKTSLVPIEAVVITSHPTLLVEPTISETLTTSVSYSIEASSLRYEPVLPSGGGDVTTVKNEAVTDHRNLGGVQEPKANSDLSSLRVDIPNPGLNLNDSDAKEILKLILANPFVKAKFDSALGNPGISQGDWRGGCLAKDTKFPTINLMAKNSSSPPNGNDKSQEIRINKFYGVKRDRFYVRNTGHGMISIKFEPEAPTSQAGIRGEHWDDEYILAQGDIYWSLDNNHGAQHSVDGQPYALELQLVHYAKKHGSLAKASTQKGGIVVTSIVFEAFGKNNPAVDPLANAAVAVGFANNKWKQVHGVLDLKMLFPVDMSYYTYTGSYIGEPCVQSATYYVFRHPQIVSYVQLQKFREVRDHNSRRSSGIFMPLSSSNDSMANERIVLSSGDAQSFLILVPEDSLSTGMEFHNQKALIVTVGTMIRLLIAVYLF